MKNKYVTTLKKGVFPILFFILHTFSVDAQSVSNVSGTVKGKESGELLSGVNVTVKGTERIVTTNVNGNFTIEAKPEETLVFSFIGYTSLEEPIDGRSNLTVELEQITSALDEVVVIGYGTQSRRLITGAVSRMDMNTVQDLPNTNVTQALRGRVAGVQFVDNGRPGQGGSILIRGTRSISAGNAPLIVLDGIFFNGSLADINPNDIESMEILKDASAAAIYGSRAANGVILITSRRGKTEKPAIRFNTYHAFNDWANKPKLLSADRYIEKMLDYRQQTDRESDPSKIEEYLTSSEAENYRNGQIVDPWDAISQRGSIQSYDLSISGRSEHTNYYLSGAMSDEKGLIYQDNHKRVSLRANVENKITDWLKVGLNSTYVNRDLSGTPASMRWAYSASPFASLFNDEAKAYPTDVSVAEDRLSRNPLYDAYQIKNEQINHNLFANIYAQLDIPFIEGLSYRLNYSPNYRWEHDYNFTRQDPYKDVNTTAASKMNRQAFDWVVENIITYKKEININNRFDVTLLYGRNHSSWESTTASTSLLANESIGWNNLNTGQLPVNQSAEASQEGISSMLRLNYDLMKRYLFTFTVRRDGSSVFASNNKFATFPSAAVGWIASDEAFLQNSTFLNFLKLRASYGSVGNQAIAPFQSLGLANTTQYVFGDGGRTYTGIFPLNMGNNNLKWETTVSSNVAVDFELFNSRIGGTLEYYNMDTRDLLLTRSLPSMTGYEEVWANLGATNNRGVEFSLNTLNVMTPSFKWRSNIVFSANKNKIKHIYNTYDENGVEEDDIGNQWFIGQPINVVYDYSMDGIYQVGDNLPAGYQPGWIRLKDLNGDGVIDALNDRSIIGQREPKYRWGFTNTFEYSQFSLSVFINAMQGWVAPFQPYDINFDVNLPGRAVNMIDGGWWTEENQNTSRPSLDYSNPYRHGYYLSRNFIRIQDVSLSYEFLPETLQDLKINTLRVYLSGKNLHTFTKWPGTDPESETGSGNISALYPMTRSFTLGATLSF